MNIRFSWLIHNLHVAIGVPGKEGLKSLPPARAPPPRLRVAIGVPGKEGLKSDVIVVRKEHIPRRVAIGVPGKEGLKCIRNNSFRKLLIMLQ